MASSPDKLISISLQDLDSLTESYERIDGPKEDFLDALYNLKNFKRWKENPVDYWRFDVMTLNNDWEADGLFVFLVSLYGILLFIEQLIECLSLSFKIGRSAFIYTITVNPERLSAVVGLLADYNIAMINDQHHSIVKRKLEQMNMWQDYEFEEHYYFSCSVEKALQVTYTVPDHIILRPLTLENVAEVNDHLGYKSENTGNYIRNMIEFLPSIGAFDRKSGEMMAWLLNYAQECHSALTVKLEYRRMGLAKLLSSKMMHDRALEGKPSHCFISSGNEASENLFLGLGFERRRKLVFGGKNGVVI